MKRWRANHTRKSWSPREGGRESETENGEGDRVLNIEGRNSLYRLACKIERSVVKVKYPEVRPATRRGRGQGECRKWELLKR